MLEFEANAARLRGLLAAEAEAGERDPEVDAGLKELRAAWKRLPAEDRALAGEISDTLRELVAARPGAPERRRPRARRNRRCPSRRRPQRSRRRRGSRSRASTA